MAEKKRQEQIAAVIRRQAADFLAAEAPGGRLVTVTKTQMSADLSYVDIYVSILPNEGKEEVIKNLKKALPGLRRRLGNKLDLRQVPQPRLEYDNRSEAQARVEEVLGEVNEEVE
jgi:ribosome-binding factor A